MGQPAGQRNIRVVIERLKANATVNASGHVDESSDANWEEWISRWAKVAYAKGSERLVGDQQTAAQVAEVEIPSDSETRNITTAMRIRLKESGVIFSISEPPVDIDGRRETVRFQVARLVM